MKFFGAIVLLSVVTAVSAKKDDVLWDSYKVYGSSFQITLICSAKVLFLIAIGWL